MNGKSKTGNKTAEFDIDDQKILRIFDKVINDDDEALNSSELSSEAGSEYLLSLDEIEKATYSTTHGRYSNTGEIADTPLTPSRSNISLSSKIGTKTDLRKGLKRQLSDDFDEKNFYESESISELDDIMDMINHANLDYERNQTNDEMEYLSDEVDENIGANVSTEDQSEAENTRTYIGSNTRSRVKRNINATNNQTVDTSAHAKKSERSSRVNHGSKNSENKKTHSKKSQKLNLSTDGRSDSYEGSSNVENESNYNSNDSVYELENSDDGSYIEDISGQEVDDEELLPQKPPRSSRTTSKAGDGVSKNQKPQGSNSARKKFYQRSLLEQLYGGSDEGSTTDSSVDALEANFKDSMRYSSGVGVRGIGKKALGGRKKKGLKRLNSKNRLGQDVVSSKEESGASDQNDINDEEELDDDSFEIEKNAWSSLQEILNFQPGFVESMKNTKNKPKKRVRSKKLSPEIMTLLGEANIHYVNRNYDKAVTYLQEVIRMDPAVSQAWHTLALIQEEAGSHDRALKLYLMSAHLAPTDSDLWKRLASLWIDQMDTLNAELKSRAGSSYEQIIKGTYTNIDPTTLEFAKKVDSIRDQALYALGKACIAEPKNLNLFLKRLSIFEELQNFPMMGVCYIGIMRIQPLNILLVRKILPLFIHNLNNTNHPTKWLSYILKTYWKVCRSDESKQISDKKFGYSDLNILIELRMIRQEYDIAILELKRGARLIQGRASEMQWESLELDDIEDLEYERDENDLPIELVVKLGQCRIMTGSIESGKGQVNKLYKYPVDEYIDLYQDITSTFREARLFHEAILICEKIMKSSGYNDSVIWAQVALFYKEVGNINRAIKYAKLVIQEDAEEVPMRVFLCEMYEKLGDIDSAIAMFSEVEMIRSKIIAEELKTPTPGFYTTNVRNPNNSWKVDRGKYVPMPFFHKSKTSDKNYYQAEKEGLIDFNAAKAGSEMNGNGESVEFNTAQSFLANDEETFLKVKTYKFSSLAVARIKAAEVVYRRQAASIRDAQLAFKKLDLLSTKNIDEKSVQVEYCRTARILFNDWRRTTAFYPSYVKRQFTGYHYTFDGLGEDVVMSTDNAYKDIQSIEDGFEKRINLLKGRLTPNLRTYKDYTADKNESNATDPSKIPTSFRGIHFEKWQKMFEMFAYVLAKMGNTEEAMTMLETISESNVFYFKGYTRAWFRLVMLKIALYSNNFETAYNIGRWLCSSKPAQGISYKIFALLLNKNIEFASHFVRSASSKFFRRQVNTVLEKIIKTPKLNKEFMELSKHNPYLSFIGISKKKKGVVVNPNSGPNKKDEESSDPEFEDIEAKKDASLNAIGLASLHSYEICLMDIKAMFLVSATISATNGSSKIAIAMYLLALTIDPKDSSALLGISFMYQQSTMNKLDYNRSEKVTKCLYFLFQYAKQREKELAEKASNSRDAKMANEAQDSETKKIDSTLSDIFTQSLDRNESSSPSILVYQNSKIEKKDTPNLNVASWVKSQEVAFNIARMFHGYNILYLSVPYYERVLELHDMNYGINENFEPHYTKQAAYNLAQLYYNSGSTGLSQILYVKYLTI